MYETELANVLGSERLISGSLVTPLSEFLTELSTTGVFRTERRVSPDVCRMMATVHQCISGLPVYTAGM